MQKSGRNPRGCGGDAKFEDVQDLAFPLFLLLPRLQFELLQDLFRHCSEFKLPFTGLFLANFLTLTLFTQLYIALYLLVEPSDVRVASTVSALISVLNLNLSWWNFPSFVTQEHGEE